MGCCNRDNFFSKVILLKRYLKETGGQHLPTRLCKTTKIKAVDPNAKFPARASKEVHTLATWLENFVKEVKKVPSNPRMAAERRRQVHIMNTYFKHWNDHVTFKRVAKMQQEKEEEGADESEKFVLAIRQLIDSPCEFTPLIEDYKQLIIDDLVQDLYGVTVPDRPPRPIRLKPLEVVEALEKEEGVPRHMRKSRGCRLRLWLECGALDDERQMSSRLNTSSSSSLTEIDAATDSDDADADTSTESGGGATTLMLPDCSSS